MMERRADMQHNVRSALRKAAQIERGRPVEEDDNLPGDFGFNHDPQTVLSVWFALRNWKVLPVAGGWLDQPEAWRDDILTCQAVFNDEFDDCGDDDGGPSMDDLLADRDGPRLKMFGE